MTLDGQRSVRLFFKLGLLVSLPVAGYLWAQTGLSQWTIGLGAICVIMALGAEGLASAAESRLAQLKAIGITLALSIVGTIVIAYIVKAVVGLRPTTEAEQQGLDITDHGEEGYIL